MVEGERIPSLKEYNRDFSIAEKKKNGNFFITNAGVEHLKQGIKIYHSGSQNPGRDCKRAGSHLLPRETGSWKTVQQDQEKIEQGKVPSYSINSQGRLCFKEDLVFGWED
jgi:hypothetical protein